MEADSVKDLEIPFWRDIFTLKDTMKALKRKNVSLERYNPIEICEEIEKILSCDEEENLSFLPNKIRKLNVGSDLCKEVCVLQRHFSSLEFGKAISEVLEEEKHEEIAGRILSMRALDKTREKYFLKRALQSIEIPTQDEPDDEEEELAAPQPAREEVPAASEPNPEDPNTYGYAMDAVQGRLANLNLTELEEPAVTEENLEQLGMSRMSQRPVITEVSEPCPEVIQREVEPRTTEGLYVEVEEPEGLLESGIHGPMTEKDLWGDPAVSIQENDYAMPELTNLPPVETPPKKPRFARPVFDEKRVISNYSERATILNEIVVVERVQVYDGPPELLQSVKVVNLMKTPSFYRGLKPVRSSVLERLYTRHLITEKKPHKDEGSEARRSANQKTIIDEDHPQPSHSKEQKTNVPIEQPIPAEIEEMQPTEVTIEEQLKRLIGTPVSKILERYAPPPSVTIGPSDPWLPARSPRMQNLSGSQIDLPLLAASFETTPQQPPSEKWKEFDFVRRRLAEVWQESDATEKRATLRQLLRNEWSKGNALTLIRILDKMSLKREILIKGIGENIVVHPYEIPYVTDKQFALRGESPKY